MDFVASYFKNVEAFDSSLSNEAHRARHRKRFSVSVGEFQIYLPGTDSGSTAK